MPRRSGDKNAFWDNASVGVGGTSTAVELPRGVDNLAIYITVDAATTVSLEVAHSGDITSEGLLPDGNAGVWFPLYYTNILVQNVFAGAGSVAILVPDFAAGWVRLKSSAAAVITAGWEAGV